MLFDHSGRSKGFFDEIIRVVVKRPIKLMGSFAACYVANRIVAVRTSACNDELRRFLSPLVDKARVSACVPCYYILHA